MPPKTGLRNHRTTGPGTALRGHPTVDPAGPSVPRKGVPTTEKRGAPYGNVGKKPEEPGRTGADAVAGVPQRPHTDAEGPREREHDDGGETEEARI